jgi:hypothetical protein
VCFTFLAVDLFDHPFKLRIQIQPIIFVIKAIKPIFIFIMDISINDMKFILLLARLLNFKQEHHLFPLDHQDHQFIDC